MRPYGKALNALDLKFRLRNTNCEWLNRPGIALSEYADTIVSNKDMIVTKLQEFTHDPAVLPFIEDTLTKHASIMTKVNMNACYKSDICAAADAIQAMSDEELVMASDFVSLGASLYLTGIHMLAAQHCTADMKDTSERIRERDELKSFRKTPSFDLYKQVIIAHYIQCNFLIVDTQTTKPATQSLSAILAERRQLFEAVDVVSADAEVRASSSRRQLFTSASAEPQTTQASTSSLPDDITTIQTTPDAPRKKKSKKLKKIK